MTFTEEYIVANGEDGEDDNVGTDEDDHDDDHEDDNDDGK